MILESDDLAGDVRLLHIRVQVLDVPPNVVLAVADDFLAQRAAELQTFVDLLMPFERALVEEPLEAFAALHERFVLRVNRLVDLQRCHPLEFLIAGRAFILAVIWK